MSLPYTKVLRRDKDDNLVVARIEELPGCSAHGSTESEALANLEDNMRAWIEDCIDSGDHVPKPAEDVELPSGKWVQRVPRSLHLKLVGLARGEGVSLNQFVTAVLAEAAGTKITQSSAQLAIPSSVPSDPWSLGPMLEPNIWETHNVLTIGQCRIEEGIHSLLNMVPGPKLNLTSRGLDSAEKEKHESWTSQRTVSSR